MTSTFPSSSAALSVPACSVFQNSWVVPLGITITRHFFDFGSREAGFARILDLWRMNQLGDLGIVHVFGSHQHLAGRDLWFDRLFLEVLDHRLDGELAHPQRILDDQPLDLPLPHRVDEGLAGVETDEDDALAAGV